MSSDDSIFRAIISKNKYYPQIPFDTLFFTDFNALMYGSGNVPGEILNFLDPTIEYLKIENKPEGSGATKQLFKLKFKGKIQRLQKMILQRLQNTCLLVQLKG